MAQQNTSEQRMFENTFAPDVKNKTLSVHDVILGLKTTLLDFDDLPTHVQDAVDAELQREADGKNAGSARTREQ